jgi:hypothetical protein
MAEAQDPRFDRENIVFYPDYDRGNFDYYLRCAEQAGVATPLFLKIIRWQELTNEEKNEFILFYSSNYPDFFSRIARMMAGNGGPPRPEGDSVHVAEWTPPRNPLNDHRDATPEQDRSEQIAMLEQQARILGFALVPLSKASKCALSGGRKSRRRSNRKNRSRR